MAIARAGTSTPSSFDSASTTTHTVSVPTGVTDGMCLVMALSGDGGANSNPTITTPGGWNLLDSAIQGSRQVLGVYWRIAASEPASYSVTTSSVKAVWMMYAYSGTDTTAPFGAAGQHSLKVETVAGTGHTTNSITPQTTNDWILSFFVDRSTTSSSKNTNWTATSPAIERLEQNNNTNGSSAWLALEGNDTNGIVGSTSAQTHSSTSVISTANALLWIGALTPPAAAAVSDPVKPRYRRYQHLIVR